VSGGAHRNSRLVVRDRVRVRSCPYNLRGGGNTRKESLMRLRKGSYQGRHWDSFKRMPVSGIRQRVGVAGPGRVWGQRLGGTVTTSVDRGELSSSIAISDIQSKGSRAQKAFQREEKRNFLAPDNTGCPRVSINTK